MDVAKSNESSDIEINSFVLSTIGLDGFPQARYVLLKEIRDRKFIFFSNYQSNKGKEIEKNNKVSLTFYWPKIFRSVRITGTASKVDRSISEEYFKSRPVSAQCGAILSMQSERLTMASKSEKVLLENNLKIQELRDMVSKAEKAEINPQTPDYWGGYQIQPIRFEFWHGMEARFHDRYLFESQDAADWKMTVLSP